MVSAVVKAATVVLAGAVMTDGFRHRERASTQKRGPVQPTSAGQPAPAAGAIDSTKG